MFAQLCGKANGRYCLRFTSCLRGAKRESGGIWGTYARPGLCPVHCLCVVGAHQVKEDAHVGARARSLLPEVVQ